LASLPAPGEGKISMASDNQYGNREDKSP